MLAAGNTLADIAADLHLTRRGVDYRVRCLRRKLRHGTEEPRTTAAWPPLIAQQG